LHQIFILLRAIVLFFLAIAISSCALLAQSINYYPDLPSSYFYHFANINPGFVPSEGSSDFSVGYKFRTGAFKDISTFLFSGAKIFRNKNESTQTVRVLLNNEQEGPYINSPKAYFNYAYSFLLDENTRLYSGVAFGASGLYFSAPSATTSVILPDGSLGIGFVHRSVSVGFASYQLFNSEVSPLLSTLRLARFYHLDANLEKELGIDWKLKIHALWRMLPQVKDEASVAFLFDYTEAISLGTAYKYYSGISFFTTFHVHSGENRLLMSFAYNAPAFAHIPRLQNSMEVSVRYLVK
jgi:hypothetical protein